MADLETIGDTHELGRYDRALGLATPEPPIERHMPDWYIEFNSDLELLKHCLRNEYYDPKDKKNPWKPAGKPIMNESGINMFISFLSATALSKNVILSNYPNYQIALENSLDMCLSAIAWLHKHYALKDIDLDINDISYIHDLIRPLIKSACLRAMQAGERGRIQQTTMTTTQLVGQAENPPPEPSAFGGGFFKFLR